MKRFSFHIAIFCMLSAGVFSCSSEENLAGASGEPLEGVSLDIASVGISQGGVESRTVINEDGSWRATNGDVVTLVAKGSTYSDANYNNWSRYACSISGADTTWNWTGSQSGDYRIRINNIAATVYGYYPDLGNKGMFAYNGSTPSIYATLLTNFSSQGTDAAACSEEVDYMYATPIDGITNRNYKVKVTMNHSLAMLKFVIARDSSYRGTGYITDVVFGDTTGATKPFKTGQWFMSLADGSYNEMASGSSRTSLLHWQDYETWGYYTGWVYHHIFNYQASTLPVEDGRVVLRTMIAPVSSVPKNAYTMKMLIDKKYITLTDCVPDRPKGYEPGYCYTYYIRFTAKALVISGDVKVERWQSGETGVNSGELIAR